MLQQRKKEQQYYLSIINTEDVLKEVQFRQVHCNLICFLGVGAGAESVILAEISRVTTEEERTGILSTMIAIRQSGLLIGKV
jgi:hypothetical protein